MWSILTPIFSKKAVDVLKPYIRCFWGTKKPVNQEKTYIKTNGIVTPDTCMDIMFHVDFTNNRIQNCFCGICK